jgi:RNA polymerase sigma-70 factor (sigma-E family)
LEGVLVRRRTPAWEDDFIAFFHARHAAYVRTAYAIVGSWAAAEDAAQEALSRVYASWPSIRGDTPDPYARRVLVNTCFRMLKSRKAETLTDLVPERPTTDDPSVRVDLMDALARLRPQDRAVIALRYLDDLSVAEVAAILGVAEGTVKSQCSRVLRQIRTQLPATRQP